MNEDIQNTEVIDKDDFEIFELNVIEPSTLQHDQ